MSNAPYRHSDGTNCYTKDCSLGNVSVHAPKSGGFSRASANLRLRRPVEVEKVTYNADGFAPDGFDRDGFAPVTYNKDHLALVENPHGVLSFRRDEENEDYEDEVSPEVHSFLVANGFTDRNGWRAAEGEWQERKYGGYINAGDESNRAYVFDGKITQNAVEFAEDIFDYWTVVRDYKFVNSKTGDTFYLHGIRNIPESKSGYTTFASRAEATYTNWHSAAAYSDYREAPFQMDLADADLVAAIEFSSDHRLIRWAAAHNPSPVVIEAMRPELLKMLPGYEDVPVEWLIKMLD